MRNDDKASAVLKEAANLYMEREGEKLTLELAAMEDAPKFAVPYHRLRFRAVMRDVRRVAYVAAPLAACLIVAFLFMRPTSGVDAPGNDVASNAQTPTAAATNATNAPAAPANAPERAEIAYLSAKLPPDCTLTDTDYDGDKTIYRIATETGDDVVIVASLGEGFEAEGFTRASAAGNDVYVKSRREYSVLLAAPQTGGVVYTMTSPFGADELLKIAASIL